MASQLRIINKRIKAMRQAFIDWFIAAAFGIALGAAVFFYL
jgi:hypothetical protein